MQNLANGLRDFQDTIFGQRNAFIILAWFDMKQRYRRSLIGPFWLTLSTGVTAIGMGLIFSTIFGLPLRDFLPFLCIGLVFWNFFVNAIGESTTVYFDSADTIKSASFPLSTHLLRMLFRNLFILAHNFLIVLLVLLVFVKLPTMNTLFILPGVLLFVSTICWLILIVSIVCARYPDVGQILINILQLAFFVTPIIWLPEIMVDRGRAIFLDVNPFYHLIEIIRSPILGTAPALKSWIFLITTNLVGWISALILLGAYKRKVAYWI